MAFQGNGNGLWGKILAALVPFAIAGLIAFSTLREKVSAQAEALTHKANQETVTVQYEAIIRRLDDISARLERLEGR